MKRIVIVLYLFGCLAACLTSLSRYPCRPEPLSVTSSVIAISFATVLWPVLLAIRLGSASINPYSMSPKSALGCSISPYGPWQPKAVGHGGEDE